MPTSAGPRTAALVAVMLVAFVLRLPTASIPPILDELTRARGLTDTTAGALAALPVWCYGVVALVASTVRFRATGRAMLLALVAIAVGAALRSAPTAAALFAGTAIVGCGGGLVNVLLPAVVRGSFGDRAGRVTGLYSAAVAAGAALAAGISVTISTANGYGWKAVLALPAAPVAVAAAWWARSFRRRSENAPQVRAPQSISPIWTDRTAWLVTGFMAFQALLYYCGQTWLPSILTPAGWSARDAGALLALYNLIGLGPTLLVPGIVLRFPRHTIVMPLSIAASAVGILGLAVDPALAVLWVALFGLGQGATMGLAYGFLVFHGRSAAHTARLAGMSQSFGYLLAALGPIALGALHSAAGDWTWPLIALAAVNAPGLALGMAATRPRAAYPWPTPSRGR